MVPTLASYFMKLHLKIDLNVCLTFVLFTSQLITSAEKLKA